MLEGSSIVIDISLISDPSNDSAVTITSVGLLGSLAVVTTTGCSLLSSLSCSSTVGCGDSLEEVDSITSYGPCSWLTSSTPSSTTIG